jgi:hypothetical protein
MDLKQVEKIQIAAIEMLDVLPVTIVVELRLMRNHIFMIVEDKNLTDL